MFRPYDPMHHAERPKSDGLNVEMRLALTPTNGLGERVLERLEPLNGLNRLRSSELLEGSED